jgi:DNA-binding beta-propeller fold protein YncE
VSVGPDPRDVAVDERTGRAFVANDDNASVSVLDSHSGAVVRQLAVGPQPRAVALDSATNRAFVINTGDGTVSVVDTRSAAVVRTIHVDTSQVVDSARRTYTGGYSTAGSYAPTGMGANGGFGMGYFESGAVVDGLTGRVFVGGAGVVAVLDARSGALVRTVTLAGDTTHMALDPATGQVLVAGGNGLTVLDGRTGQVRSALYAGGPASAVAVDPRRARIFVAHTGAVDKYGTPLGTGTVTVLDARSGKVMRTMDVGVAPQALAVDERNGQAIVVNAGGDVQARSAWAWLPPSLQGVLPFTTRPSGTRTEPGSLSVLDASR